MSTPDLFWHHSDMREAREQHIRREKATSNICTSQALLANMAAMYAVYHGPTGLRAIANKTHNLTHALKATIESFGYKVVNEHFFDTLTIDVSGAAGHSDKVHAASAAASLNFRRIDERHVGVTLDESVGPVYLLEIINVFASAASVSPLTVSDITISTSGSPIIKALERTSEILPHPVFNKHHSETEMLRYIFHLASKDLGLVHAMIPLGSCTMKLNSTSSMIPVTWPEFSAVHPFVPTDQVAGYLEIIKVGEQILGRLLELSFVIQELSDDLCKITGFAACSLQPNSGAAGEYAGLTVIRAYQESIGEGHRDVCLIPLSAHGTNPAVSIILLNDHTMLTFT